MRKLLIVGLLLITGVSFAGGGGGRGDIDMGSYSPKVVRSS